MICAVKTTLLNK